MAKAEITRVKPVIVLTLDEEEVDLIMAMVSKVGDSDVADRLYGCSVSAGRGAQNQPGFFP